MSDDALYVIHIGESIELITTEVDAGMSEMVAYGTAVVVEPISQTAS